MLTLNADDHHFMRNFHKPEDEKRMVVVLPDDHYEAWLQAKPQHRMDFIKPYPADQMAVSN